MGANYEGQEKALEELRALSPEAKGFIGHHINNALCGVLGGIETKNLESAKECAWHICDDLRLMGIMSGQRSEGDTLKDEVPELEVAC